MENENKDKNIILTDEQLKEVAGGIHTPYSTTACKNYTKASCNRLPHCIWKDGRCVDKNQE